MSSIFFVLSFYALVCSVYLRLRSQRTSKAEHYAEPTYVPEAVPFLTHTIGLFRHGANYYKSLSKFHFPIFTLRMFNTRTYVICDSTIINKVQRTPTISFKPLVVLAAERLAGASKSCLDLIQNECTEKSKHHHAGVIEDTHSRLHTILRPGPSTDAMLRVMMNSVSELLEEVSDVDLFAWARHTVCLASTDAVYGPGNPFRADASLESAFWDYDAGLPLLLLGVMPRFMARKAYQAREALKLAFTRFYNDGSSSKASDLIQSSHEANSRHGVSNADQGAFELTTCIGLLVNTAPALYWTLLYTYSDPKLLARLRDEVTSLVQEGPDGQFVNIKRCKDECGLLYSTFKEVLRLHASSLSSRVVTEDTVIKNEVRFRRGSIVHIPSAILHQDPNHWGSDAATFNPERFLESADSTAVRRSTGVAYRPFAGGSTLCPGRHLATLEILGIVAMVILKFDLIPETGKWTVPPQFEGTMTTTVLPPLEDTRVRFHSRESALPIGFVVQ